MKFSKPTVIAIASVLAAEPAIARFRDDDEPDCTTYHTDGPTMLKNSGVFRSARIDQITSATQCINIADKFGGVLGATFCSGDTFSIGVTPVYDMHGEEVGYYTRSGMRVPLYDPPAEDEDFNPAVGLAFNAFVFTNGDQLHFQGVDPAGSPAPLRTAISAGTGDFIGAKGEVIITDFLSATYPNEFEVCLY